MDLADLADHAWQASSQLRRSHLAAPRLPIKPSRGLTSLPHGQRTLPAPHGILPAFQTAPALNRSHENVPPVDDFRGLTLLGLAHKLLHIAPVTNALEGERIAISYAEESAPMHSLRPEHNVIWKLEETAERAIYTVYIDGIVDLSDYRREQNESAEKGQVWHCAFRLRRCIEDLSHPKAGLAANSLEHLFTYLTRKTINQAIRDRDSRIMTRDWVEDDEEDMLEKMDWEESGEEGSEGSDWEEEEKKNGANGNNASDRE